MCDVLFGWAMHIPQSRTGYSAIKLREKQKKRTTILPHNRGTKLSPTMPLSWRFPITVWLLSLTPVNPFVVSHTDTFIRIIVYRCNNMQQLVDFNGIKPLRLVQNRETWAYREECIGPQWMLLILKKKLLTLPSKIYAHFSGRLKTQVRKTKVPEDGICKYGIRKYEYARVGNASTENASTNPQRWKT